MNWPIPQRCSARPRGRDAPPPLAEQGRRARRWRQRRLATDRAQRDRSRAAGGRTLAAATAHREAGRRPLLLIDGDSIAHRAYHALPKNIRRKGDRPAGAILGFANVLLRDEIRDDRELLHHVVVELAPALIGGMLFMATSTARGRSSR